MTLAVFIAAYAATALLLGGCVRLALRYARMPVHLRWELYPVPHEAPERAAHGGSYFEESEWWHKPLRTNRLGELRAMLPEMLFLAGLWRANRSLWWRSYAFHLGLYLLIASASVGWLVPSAARIAAVVGFAMTFAGASALLVRRVLDPALRNYTYPADLAQLAGFAASSLLLLIGSLVQPVSAGSLLRAALAFDATLRIPLPTAVGAFIACILAAHLPYSAMAHFLAKYFTYHSVRWDDRAMDTGMEQRIARQLQLTPSWTAPHIAADGRRTWADIATADPTAEVRR